MTKISIKSKCKKTLIQHRRLTWFLFVIKRNIIKHFHEGNLKIQCEGIAKIKKSVKGKNNHLIIEEGCIAVY